MTSADRTLARLDLGAQLNQKNWPYHRLKRLHAPYPPDSVQWLDGEEILGASFSRTLDFVFDMVYTAYPQNRSNTDNGQELTSGSRPDWTGTSTI